LSIQPDKETLADMYGAHYFESDFRCGAAPARGLGGKDSEEVFALEAQSALSLIRRFTGRSTGRLLEIGSAGGWFLKTAREAGWDVRGVEFSRDAAEFARSHLALDVFCGELADAGFPPQRFDVIYLADVLEHIPEPLQFVRELHRVLAPDGAVVVCGPTALNSLARRLGLFAYKLFGKTRSIALAPYHLFEYTPRTMGLLFEGGGFEVVRTWKQKITPTLTTSDLEGVGVFVLELLSYPVTRFFGVWSDRIVLCARPARRG
jgi:SAM-dependent methyltransferase